VTAGTPVEGNNIIRYPFNIETGIKYDSVEFLFPANTQVPGKALNRFLEKMKLRTLTFYDPVQVVDELIQYYKERGFLEVRINPPEIRYFPGLKKTSVTFIITEGPQARIGQITFNGNRFLKTDVLLKKLSLKKDDVFSPVKLNEVSYEISNAYAQKGFNEIRVTYTKQYVSGIGVMNLVFNIEENQRGVIREIIITGNSLTRTSVIQRELTFKQGDTLDFNQVNKSRMKLYELEIFQWIDIDAQPMAEETPGSEKPFRIVIEASEIRPFRVKGGLQWDTDKKLGAVMEFSSPNTFGKAHYLGTSFIIDQKENGFKAYYRFPYFFKKKIATEFFAFGGKKVELSYTINRKGLTLQQQYRYREKLLFSFSYNWERDHVIKPGSSVESGLISTSIPALDIKFNLGYLTAALTYDRRNNIVNPTRGFFLSGSWLYARKFLGSQVNFYRFYGEGQLYLPVSGFLVIASSVRAGSGRGLGQEYLPGERFLAGGGNTLRGFKESMVGPLDINGKPIGGEALFIFNQELRIRLSDMFIFVLFADMGNVYGAAREFDIFNVRKSAGFGVRVYAGPLLLRADLGFILNRRQGEPSSRLILSIGQAF
ncbi:MAG TPA: BamA/TamA family outer membrane protein, partial [Candidatus Kapabacteria bacterium]|nr:BamA/TamA family outer membrane protein [Candidatus Kapabacteria bacterium]